MHGFAKKVEGLPEAPDADPLPRARTPAAAKRLSLLRTIEDEVIPRLVLARRATPATPRDALQDGGGWHPGVDAIAEFSQLVLTRDAAVACAHAQALLKRGVAAERLYLDLLTPSARHLGRLWEEDLCDFATITTGLVRLQQVLHALQPTFAGEGGQALRGKRALLVAVPGEQHTFGLFMVTAFFRRAGWSVWNEPLASIDDVVRLVRAQSFAVIGFSAGSEVRVNAVAAVVRGVRRASCNRGVGILVGGPLFLERPDLVSLVGADAMAADGRGAVVQAQDMLNLLARPA